MSSLSKAAGLPIPDLRFEQSFLLLLRKYADFHTLSAAELQLPDGVDENTPQSTPDAFKPVTPVTPGIVTYAVIKDHIVMPLIQGFLYSGLLLCIRPVMGAIVAHGQLCGTWLVNLVGLNKQYRGFA